MKKILLYLFAFTFILNSLAMAYGNDDALTTLKSKLDAVIEVLQKKDLELQQKKEKVVEIVTPLFAFNIMARLTLKKHWKGLPEEKRKRFTDLFIELLKTSYINQLSQYNDEKVIYSTPITVKKKVHIPTEVVSQDKKIIILYKLYKSKQGWQIYDISVEGVSVIQTYRSQFDEALSTGTIDDLILKLEQKIKSPSNTNDT
jgi:phospholipid transport system substrate-binding protein